jgi:hypothetical protein
VWATRPDAPPWIRRVLQLSSCVFLSTDAFHADAMADERFVRAARAIAREDVWIVVQVLELEDMVERAEALLRAAFGADFSAFAELHLTQPLAYGRGEAVFMRTKHMPGRSFGPCELVSAPVIRYDGRLSGCCNERVLMGGGPERLRARCGSSEEVVAAVEGFYGDPLLAAIGRVGPGALTRHPRFADLADEEFPSICGVCWKMLARTQDDAQVDPVLGALALVGGEPR